MHNFQTGAAYRYTGSIRVEKKRTTLCGPVHGIPYDHPRVTGILALTVPVNYPGAPCDLGITKNNMGFGSGNSHSLLV